MTSPVPTAESFIGHFTLSEHLKGSSGAPLRLDAARTQALFGDLRTLEAGSGQAWGLTVRAAYERSFGVSLEESVRGGTPRVLGNVSVTFSVPCVVPPWKDAAGGVDVADPQHVRAVRALVHRILWKPSLTDGAYRASGDPESQAAGANLGESDEDSAYHWWQLPVDDDVADRESDLEARL